MVIIYLRLQCSLSHQNLILDSFIISSNMFMETLFWLDAQGQTIAIVAYSLSLYYFYSTKIIFCDLKLAAEEKYRGD